MTIGVWDKNPACTVLVETRTGDVLGALELPGRPEALSNDGTTVYFAHDAATCDDLMVGSHDLLSGRTTWIGHGSEVALSNDGRSLAYVSSAAIRGGGAASRGSQSTCDQRTLVIRDVESHRERTVDSSLPGDTTRLAWSPDGRFIAMSGLGGDVSHAAVVDLSKGADAVVVVADSIQVDGEHNTGVRGWLSDGRLVVDVFGYPGSGSETDRSLAVAGKPVVLADGRWRFEMTDAIGPALDRYVTASVPEARLLLAYREGVSVEIGTASVRLPLWRAIWPASTNTIAAS